MGDVLGDIGPYLLILGTLVLLSGFFSGTEVAMFSLRRVDREQMKSATNKADALVARLLSKPRQLIATVLIGNEVVNVSVSTVMASMTPLLFPGTSELTLALLTTFMALPLLLFFGEITPKSLAIKTSLGWVRFAARPLWLWSWLVLPVRVVVHFIAGLALRPFGSSTASRVSKQMSEAEFRTLVDAGSAEGAVDVREQLLIHKVFEFGDKTVGDIMEPRDKIFALSYELPLTRLVKEVATRGYSRVPIYQKSLDNIRGILYAKDLVVQAAALAAPRPLTQLLHEPLFVPRTIPLERLFRIFKNRKIHMALVVNEYGKLIGLITMEDLLEELFGEIRDEREQLKTGRRAAVRVRSDSGVVRVALASDRGPRKERR